MSLSKVYRGDEYSELESFEFRSFSKPKTPSDLRADTSSGPASIAASILPNEVEEAFSRGRLEGTSATESKLETTLQALLQALDEVNALRAKVARNSSQDMLRMVMAVSEQIVLRAITVEPEIVLSVIENALHASVQADNYRIRVSPQDFELVNQQKPLFLASISGMKNISILSEPDIAPGGCRVESDFGDVDATIETQLAEIRKSLSGAILGVD